MTQIETSSSPQSNKLPWLALLVLFIGAIIVIFLIISGVFNQNRPIKPLVPTATAGVLLAEYAPITVNFFDLGDDPVQYRNQRIRVTGRFSRIALPDCQPYAGPVVEWGLINDTLQMNAVGYENIVRGLRDNTEMTVEGIWTFYPGSIGCGKEPMEQQGIWYLKVEQILQPNPIVTSNSSLAAQLNVIEETRDGVTVIAPESTGTVESGEPAPTSDPSAPPTLIATATSTVSNIGNSTATVRATVPPNSSSTPTPTATVGATVPPNSSSTPTPAATSTAVPTISPPATSTPGAPPPPAPTATPGGGYPPPPGDGGYP